MIRVDAPGFFTTVQDLGRFGYADMGVPCSGVMDRYSAQLANQIVGNDPGDSLLELGLGKTSLVFEKETIICVCGADFSAILNNGNIDLNKSILVRENDELTFEKPIYGARAYLAVKGGVQTSEVLGSRSFYPGVTLQSLLKKGDVLPIAKQGGVKFQNNASVKIDMGHFTDVELLVYPGPEYELLNLKQKRELQALVFSVSNDVSRMGYRLEGVVENQLTSMLTSAVLPGTVQLTPSGGLIVLMRDCQVTGGYPRVLQLSEMAINRLAQKLPGDKIQFKIVSLDR